MIEWLAENRTFAVVAALCGISGVNIAMFLKWLWRAANSRSGPRLPNEHLHLEESDQSIPELSVNAPSGTLHEEVALDKTPTTPSQLSERSPKLINGYLVLWGREIVDDVLMSFVAFETVTVGAFGLPLLFALLFQVQSSAQAIVAFILFQIAAWKFAWWLRDRHCFVINIADQSTIHINRGIPRTLKTVVLELHAEQVALDAWIPMILVSDLAVAEGEQQPTKKQALRHFDQQGRDLGKIMRARVLWSWHEWHEWRKRASTVRQTLLRLVGKNHS